MMDGDFIAALARRLLREETFTLVAAPAIADLQRGASASRAALWIGVFRALIGGLVIDLAQDVRAASRLCIDLGNVRVFLAAVVSLSVLQFALLSAGFPFRSPAGGVPVVHWAFGGSREIEFSGADLLTFAMFLAPVVIAVSAPPALVLVGRRLAERAKAGRTLVAASLIFSAGLFVVTDTVVRPATDAYIEAAAAVRQRGRDVPRQAQLAQPPLDPAERQALDERRALAAERWVRLARWRSLAFAASPGAFLMIGLALVRTRMGMVFVYAVMLGFVYAIVGAPLTPILALPWIPSADFSALAVAAMRLRAREAAGGSA